MEINGYPLEIVKAGKGRGWQAKSEDRKREKRISRLGNNYPYYLKYFVWI